MSPGSSPTCATACGGSTPTVSEVVVSPVGFVSDHIEVLYDLDVEAAEAARELGLTMVRAGAAGTHPAFVGMIRELVEERLGTVAERRTVGRYGPSHDVCAASCCLPGTGRRSPWDAEVSATA